MSSHPMVQESLMVVLIARRGKPLPKGVEIHHVNCDTEDNRRGNLVVCQDHSYHMLLQRRQRAKAACGHADWLKCHICHQWDAPAELRRRNASKVEHSACATTATREWRRQHRAHSQAYMRKYLRGWRARNVEKRRAYQREWYRRNRLKPLGGEGDE